MIVRIATEGQYELPENDVEKLNELDNRTVDACREGDEAQFTQIFKEMLEFVRRNGQPVADDHLGGSDLILPPPDSSMQEVRDEFTGEGLIPD